MPRLKNHRSGFILMLMILASTSFGSAQTVVLKAARMLDVKTGRMIEPAVIVIEGDMIIDVNPAPEDLPEDATIEDLGDLTLLPGLMDMHTHLCFDIEGDWVHRGIKEGPADAALRGARNARITLLTGFTTVRDVGATGFADVSLMRAIDNGLITGPRMFPAGHALGITGGHCDSTGYAPGVLENGPKCGVADGPIECLKSTRYQIKHGAKVIKICATAGVLSFEGPVGAQQYSEQEMRVIVEEAARHGIKVAAHAHGSAGILAAVKAGVASIEHGSELTGEILSEMKARGTYLVPTSYLVDAIDLDSLPPPIKAKAEYILPIARESLRSAIASGINIAFGTDAAVFPHGENAREFKVYVDQGMSPIEAIRSATIHAADLLGVDDRGVIAKDKLADLIGVVGNPLEDITTMERVQFVMKGGQVFKRGE
ncbi:MAG: amidohydrolase family protein [Planctomycetota bacterium]|nr:amidohydrolase family protein [Planctomycetota bacterium]